MCYTMNRFRLVAWRSISSKEFDESKFKLGPMRLINFCVGISLFFAACGDCEDIKIGELSQPEYFKDYIVHDQGDMVTFEDGAGNTRVFTVQQSEIEDRAFGEVIGTNNTQDGTVECFEYNSVVVPHLIYFLNNPDANTSNETSISVRILAWGRSNSMDQEIATALELYYSSDDNGNFGGAQGFYHITEERSLLEGETPRFAKLDEWQGHGKTYQNVLHYSTDEGGFYFSIGSGFVGLVGFDGVLWTLNE